MAKPTKATSAGAPSQRNPKGHKNAPALNWHDPAACKAWLDDIASLVESAIDAAEDQMRKHREREFGPKRARRVLSEAKTGIIAQLAYGRAGLSATQGPEGATPASTPARGAGEGSGGGKDK